MQVDANTWFYCTTITVVILLSIFGAEHVKSIVVAVCRHGKACDFFMFHHKADAAAQVRHLKMVMQALADLSFFIESDDLRDLNGLFSVIQNDVKTLVAYMPRDVLHRAWCAGEVATAALGFSRRWSW